MWAAATPPSEEQRRAGLVAFLLVPVLATGLAAGALRLAEHGDQPPPHVERSYVLEPAGGTEQRLIPSPARPDPAAAVVTVCSPAGPAAATACPPATLTSPPEPAPPPAPAAPPVAAPQAPPSNPAAAALANLINARLADPRLAGTTVGLSVWVEGLGRLSMLVSAAGERGWRGAHREP